MLRLINLQLPPEEDGPERLREAAAARLRLSPSALGALRIVRRSIDARRKDAIRLVYTVDAEVEQEQRCLRKAPEGVSLAEDRPYALPQIRRLPALRSVVAGFGPAGMFAALALAEAGLRPIVLERGLDVDARAEKVRLFRETGLLDPACNVQFGEGGAGTFSDGKLNTGVGGSAADYVLRRLAGFGAGERVVWDAAPHVGTDVLRDVVKRLRQHILSLGGEVRFHTRLTGLRGVGGRLRGVEIECGGARETLDCDTLLLAVGHSARDTLEMLFSCGLEMSPKAFSMGLRIEHRQADIDKAQFGAYAGCPALGPAAYKLAVHLPDGQGVYTFCMCPGGYVMAAASEEGGVVTNGMSNQARDGENANAALLASLPPERFPYPGPLGGVTWQRELERAAYRLGGGDYRAPAQLVGDFLSGRPSRGPGRVQPSYRPGVVWGDVRGVLPEAVWKPLAEALPLLERKLRGFAAPDAVLTGTETRSSSPVRLARDASLQATRLRGLYPCGEGAGWAGGIVSAAVDGLRCAEAVLRSLV